VFVIKYWVSAVLTGLTYAYWARMLRMFLPTVSPPTVRSIQRIMVVQKRKLQLQQLSAASFL